MIVALSKGHIIRVTLPGKEDSLVCVRVTYEFRGSRAVRVKTEVVEIYLECV
jgi:hypothetical protein